MTPEINEILKRLATAKGVTVTLIAVFLFIFVWSNIDFLTEVTFTVRKSDETAQSLTVRDKVKAKHEGLPELAIRKVLLPPAPRDLPVIVVFELANPGSGIVHNVRGSFDFGSAKVLNYELLGPSPDSVTASPPGSSLITITVQEMGPGESVYLYAQTSLPTFKAVTLSSTDLVSPVILTFETFRARTDNENPDFISFLYFLAGAFILVMSVYLTSALVMFLNRWFKL